MMKWNWVSMLNISMCQSNWTIILLLPFLDPESEGPVKYPPYVCFELFGVFLQKHLEEFSDLIHAVRVSSNLKSEGVRFFEKKSCSWNFGLKSAKYEIFQVFWKIYARNFSAFFAWTYNTKS